ncbi:MAG: transaldolase [Chlamydiae bacterium]|nr:transaldolase [Chlamydiota bacterium]
MSTLEDLKKITVVVADTGQFHELKKYSPQDATTNPSLILEAIKDPAYLPLLKETVKGKKDVYSAYMDLFIAFGVEILKFLPPNGRVSIEVDPKLSWDKDASIVFAHKIIDRFAKKGIGSEKILIKLASTYEGAEAARILERMGIHCNMTLLFSMAQASICADAGVTLISPFVGRITDFYKKEKGVTDFSPEDDPGVQSVRRIYSYLKKFGYKTQVMGASFRSSKQILALAGSDLLTIAPKFLEEMSQSQQAVPKKLDLEMAKNSDVSKLSLNQSSFEFLHNEDHGAAFLLSDGIRRFAKDLDTLLGIVAKEV